MILHVAMGGSLRKLTLERSGDDGSFVCSVEGETIHGTARLLEPGLLSLLIEGRSYRCLLEPETPGGGNGDAALRVDGERYEYRLEDPRSLKARRAHAGGDTGPRPLKAPMPGRVVRVLAEAGAAVEAHQAVLVIEAMKMQNEVKAPRAGTLRDLRVSVGDTVNAGQVLAIVQ